MQNVQAAEGLSPERIQSRSRPRVQGTLPRVPAAIQGNMAPENSEIEMHLAELGRSFYARGWALGTSGNYSAVVTRDPLLIAITPTGVDKGSLTPQQFLRIDANGAVKEGQGQPSAETALHLAIMRV